MTLLIKSATIHDKGQPTLHLKKRDILIQNGTITAIGGELKPKGKTQTIKGKNLHVSPGWFDSSVSFGEPGYEERETISRGLEVAAKGGATAVIQTGWSVKDQEVIDTADKYDMAMVFTGIRHFRH